MSTRLLRSVLGLLPLCALLACSGDDHAASATVAVVDGVLRDAQGRALILRGVNISQQHKVAPYFGFHQQSDIARVRQAWGFNGMRWVFPWAAVEPQAGQFDSKFVEQLITRLHWAKAAGLYVVLDMHQDVFGEGFTAGNGAPRWACDEQRYRDHVPEADWFLNYTSKQVAACFDELWKTPARRQHIIDAWVFVARAVAADTELRQTVIGFDPFNEAYWGSHTLQTFERDVLSGFYAEIVSAVRKVAPNWVAFVQPAASRNLDLPTSLKPPSFDNAVYAPHVYDPQAEQGLGFGPERVASLLAKMQAMADEAKRLGTALWFGEYGGMVDDPDIATYMGTVYDGAGKLATGAMIWEYGNSGPYRLIDPDGSEMPQIAAVVRPYPARIAGTLTDYRYDVATKRMVVRFVPDPALSAPSEFVLPARLYPAEIDVACAGCDYQRQGDLLRIDSGPLGASLRELTVSPRP